MSSDPASSPTELDAVARRIGRVVRAARTDRALSLGELARAAGLSRTILARIESGSGNPSVETLWRVSQALDLPLGALVAAEPAPRVRVVRSGTGEPLSSAAGMRAWLVHAEGRPHRSEVFELDLPAGVEQRNDAHLPGTQEVVVCLRGRLLAGPLGEEAELRPGDAVWFAADVAHRYRGVRDARAIDLLLYAATA
jgi:XRE family transcriptional regulator, regulator of sulfur utilization